MDILEKLWLGQLLPIENNLHKSNEYSKALHNVTENQLILKELLPNAVQSVWHTYNESQTVLLDYAERAAFSQGFCLGAKLMMAVMEKE